MRVVGLLTVMILKIVSKSIFFQSKRFTACKVKDEKGVTNLNLLHILLHIKNFFVILHITYYIFSSNIFLITVNENLHFKI